MDKIFKIQARNVGQYTYSPSYVEHLEEEVTRLAEFMAIFQEHGAAVHAWANMPLEKMEEKENLGLLTPGRHITTSKTTDLERKPSKIDDQSQQEFSQICCKILTELDDLEAPACYGIMAQVDSLLEAMFDCSFGEGESLKSIVVAIQSQLNGVDWTRDTVEFLRNAMTFLLAQYVVNEQTVDEIYAMMREKNLDSFRGSVSEGRGSDR